VQPFNSYTRHTGSGYIKTHYIMKQIKLLVLSIFSLLAVNIANACHQSTVTYLSHTENANGTYTYDLRICIGFENTWGFQLTFNTANIVGVTPNCLLSASSGLNACATVSGNVVEYGDMDNTGAPAWLPGGNGVACYNISVTLDAPASSVNMYGAEWNFGPCSASAPLPSCFPSNATYTVMIDTYGPCNKGGNVTWSVDGTQIASVGQNGAATTWLYCGACGTTLTINANAGTTGPEPRCPGGVEAYEVYNSSGVLIASGGGDNSTSYSANISCVPLSADFLLFEGKKQTNSIIVNWTSIEEVSDLMYIVERSTDLVNWSALGFLKSDNEVNTKLNYAYEDRYPHDGDNYYRLKVLNPNISEKIFGPIIVDFRKKKPKLIKTVNILGQTLDENFRGYAIEIYEDGTTHKVYKE
jgi:hypothetical protein